MTKYDRKYSSGVRHHTKTFKAGVTEKLKQFCEECKQAFTKQNYLVLFGSCKLQICKRCWEKKL